MKLLFIPGLIEAFVDGGLAVALFSMPPLFGFSLGFILKAIGPALVIQLMFEVMARGLGLAKGVFEVSIHVLFCNRIDSMHLESTFLNAPNKRHLSVCHRDAHDCGGGCEL